MQKTEETLNDDKDGQLIDEVPGITDTQQAIRL